MNQSPNTILACLCVYNEIDILPYLLRHLRLQGISIFVFDNYSTDGTWEFLNDNHFSCERLDTHGQLNLDLIIRTKIEKWHSAGPAWCIYQDADEFPYTSVFQTLRDFIMERDKEGFNVISQKRYQFMPTGEEDFSRGDPRRIFEYYGKRPTRIERIFKYHPGLSPSTCGSGGCWPRADEQKSWETLANPILEYSLRKNPEMKVEERLERCPELELLRGWHAHYVSWSEYKELMWRKEKLFKISDPESPLYRFRFDKG